MIINPSTFSCQSVVEVNRFKFKIVIVLNNTKSHCYREYMTIIRTLNHGDETSR